MTFPVNTSKKSKDSDAVDAFRFFTTDRERFTESSKTILLYLPEAIASCLGMLVSIGFKIERRLEAVWAESSL